MATFKVVVRKRELTDFIQCTFVVMFAHLSSSVLTRWINSLSLTNRVKEMYPTCLRQIFKRALIELNDEEHDAFKCKFKDFVSKLNINWLYITAKLYRFYYLCIRKLREGLSA